MNFSKISHSLNDVGISSVEISFEHLGHWSTIRALLCCSEICQQQNKCDLILHDGILFEKIVITPDSSLPYILVGLFVTRTKRRSR